ncbi:MAG: quinone oxidoreductase [Gemmatimonadetes bacterium]|nr:quinone oxidoreductase [Gemmatimonadota bacterium]
MRAIRIHQHGGPDALRPEDVPLAEPTADQARVRIHFAGINFIDVYHRTGLYRIEPPFTPGVEAAGVVEAVGPVVSEVRPGDRVAYASEVGAYAEQALVPAWKLVPVPASLELSDAAALMLQGMTAHYLVHSTYPVADGETILVHAAAGGVGLLLVQLAKARGARVIGTVSTEAKAALAREAGADDVVLYTREDFLAAARRLTGGRGVDVVYDSVGRDTFERSLECLRPRGYLVLYGQSSGPVPPFDPGRLARLGSLFLTRPSLGDYTADRDELLWRAADLFRRIEEKTLRVRIDRVLPLEEAAEAHRLLEGRKTAGKVLLQVGQGR